MKHTPGPWKSAPAFENNAPNYFAVVTGAWGAPAIAKVYSGEANACLIAAAPEMLAMLANLERSFDAIASGDWDEDNALERNEHCATVAVEIRALLARIDGKETP